jgi:hypothetical protein
MCERKSVLKSVCEKKKTRKSACAYPRESVYILQNVQVSAQLVCAHGERSGLVHVAGPKAAQFPMTSAQGGADVVVITVIRDRTTTSIRIFRIIHVIEAGYKHACTAICRIPYV